MPSTIEAIFAFEFSLEAANKNFILLNRKFGGDFSKALLAQSNSPLGYGSEFKPTKTLELIFKNHPSWSRMKRILTHGSKWPLQPLDEEDRIKVVAEALNFGNHKGWRHVSSTTISMTEPPLSFAAASPYVASATTAAAAPPPMSPLPPSHCFCRRRRPNADDDAAAAIAADILHNTNTK